MKGDDSDHDDQVVEDTPLAIKVIEYVESRWEEENEEELKFDVEEPLAADTDGWGNELELVIDEPPKVVFIEETSTIKEEPSKDSVREVTSNAA